MNLVRILQLIRGFTMRILYLKAGLVMPVEMMQEQQKNLKFICKELIQLIQATIYGQH